MKELDYAATTQRRDLLRKRIDSCTNCALGGQGNNVAFSGQVHNPKFIIIGEAPGEWEVEYGKPFVGRAGKMLWSEMKRHGITRADVFTMNSASCRPTSLNDDRTTNRTPLQSELNACAGIFAAQLSLVSHCNFILALGNTALRKFKPDGKIGDWTGRPIYIDRKNKPGRIVVPTYHPSGVLRNPDLHEGFSEAVTFLIAMVNLGERFLEICPDQCHSCGSDDVTWMNEEGRWWCGPCYLEDFQLPIPGMKRAQPPGLIIGKSGKILRKKRAR